MDVASIHFSQVDVFVQPYGLAIGYAMDTAWTESEDHDYGNHGLLSTAS